MNWTPC